MASGCKTFLAPNISILMVIEKPISYHANTEYYFNRHFFGVHSFPFQNVYKEQLFTKAKSICLGFF